jgi:hypothetical protein
MILEWHWVALGEQWNGNGMAMGWQWDRNGIAIE